MGLMLLEAYAQITFVHIFATEPLRHFPIFWTGVSFRVGIFSGYALQVFVFTGVLWLR
jgi:hypothetical protein